MQLEEAKGYEVLCRREYERNPSVNRMAEVARSVDTHAGAKVEA